MKPGKTLRFKTLLPVLICALLALGVTSQTALALELGPTGLRLSGEVAQTASWFFDPGELVIGVTRYKLSLDQSLRRAGIGIDGHLHVSVKGWYDHEASEGKWIELGEAYADIYHDLFDLRGHKVYQSVSMDELRHRQSNGFGQIEPNANGCCRSPSLLRTTHIHMGTVSADIGIAGPDQASRVPSLKHRHRSYTVCSHQRRAGSVDGRD